MPTAELAAVAAEFGVPMHSDAVQAVGQLPVDFAASGLSAMSVAAHKFGGPPAVGALLLRRDVTCVPLLHGGGQERDIRSGTPDVAGAVGMATAAQIAVDGLEANSARLRVLRDRLVDGCAGRDRRRQPQRCPRPAATSGQRALHVPRLRRRCVVDAVGRQRNRVFDRIGLHRRCRAAVARADRDGRRPGQRPWIAAYFRWGTPVSTPTSMRCCRCCPGRWTAPDGLRWPLRGRPGESSRRDEWWRRLVGRRRPHGRCRTRRGRCAPGAVDRARHAAHRLARLLLQRRCLRRAPRRRRARNPLLCLGFRGEVQSKT